MMIRAAIALAERGLAVFPCRQQSKEPATAHGFYDASKDVAVVERWWHNNPNFNIGVATGAVSNLLVVDIDNIDAEAELRRMEAEHGAPLPATVEVITTRGRHIYFRMPTGLDIRCSTSEIGIDIRANGGYVLAPPSIHPSGRRYAWSVDAANALAAAPDWLLNRIVAHSGGNGNAAAPVSEWRELAKGVTEGARDCSLARLAGYLLRRRVDVFMTLELLHAFNTTRCSPPLPDGDVVRIVGSIAGRELKQRGVSK